MFVILLCCHFRWQ